MTEPRTHVMGNAAEAPCTRCGATPETGQRDDCPECQGTLPPTKESGSVFDTLLENAIAFLRERSEDDLDSTLDANSTFLILEHIDFLVAERDELREQLYRFSWDAEVRAFLERHP